MKQNRKRLKNKRRSCGLCKPHKRGHTNRWTFSALREGTDVESEFERWRQEERDRIEGPAMWDSWMTGRPWW